MVIQRWQSVLLLLAAVAMATFSFLTLGQVKLQEYTLDFTTLGFHIDGVAANGAESGYYMRTWSFFMVSLMCAVIPLINIFLFRNLRLQKTLCLIGILFIFVLIVIGWGYGYRTFENVSVKWSPAIIAPFLALIATVMGFVRINADQKMLRSADRIR